MIVTDVVLETCFRERTYVFSRNIGRKEGPYPRCQGQSCSCQSDTVAKELKSREKAQ